MLQPEPSHLHTATQVAGTATLEYTQQIRNLPFYKVGQVEQIMYIWCNLNTRSRLVVQPSTGYVGLNGHPCNGMTHSNSALGTQHCHRNTTIWWSIGVVLDYSAVPFPWCIPEDKWGGREGRQVGGAWKAYMSQKRSLTHCRLCINRIFIGSSAREMCDGAAKSNI